MERIEMEQKKIDELKKLIGFGLLTADRIKNDTNFKELVSTLSFNDLVPLFAHCACAYDNEYHPNMHKFKEPQITNLLEKTYADYLEFKKSDEL